MWSSTDSMETWKLGSRMLPRTLSSLSSASEERTIRDAPSMQLTGCITKGSATRAETSSCSEKPSLQLPLREPPAALRPPAGAHC
ncbi:hypothetical protein EYF80_064429 [Liparis tanakae]|uniref:Uncharacterized protein n=1 Tax=Liparis tanakae TaxID=230148 RepID=A0A4Z2EB06_9TELE|nr:hypothetical protein EYF80_064429 [Liparis tanakae]